MSAPRPARSFPPLACLCLAACGSAVAPAAPPVTSVATTHPASDQRVQPRPFISPNSYASYVRAEVLAGRGEYGAAVDLYRVALAESGPDPWLLGRLSRALDAAGQPDEAMALLRDALSEHPHWALWLALGDLERRRGEPERAIAAYERTIATSDGPEGAIALARLLRSRNQPQRAIAVLEEAARRSARYSTDAATAELELALSQRDPVGVERAVVRLRGLRAVPRKALIEAAEVELAAGRSVMAARLLDAIPVASDDAAIRVRAWLAAGRKQAAAGLLTTFHPDVLGGRLPMAGALLEANQPAQALTLAEQQIVTAEVAPPSPEQTLARDRARLLAARAQLALGQPGAAATTLSGLPEESPVSTEARALTATVLQAAGLSHLVAETDE